LMTPDGIAAALYYIIHSTLAGAALFLIVDLVKSSRPSLSLVAMSPVAGASLTAGLFFAAAIAMAGLPPLSGFVGKLMILDASFETPFGVWVWVVVLAASLISLIGFARAGSIVFWKAESVPVVEDDEVFERPHALSYGAVGGLITLLAAYTVFGGQAQSYMMSTSQQLFAPDAYIETIIGSHGKMSNPLSEEH
jgi:multicomponent K+:H+ antiporter subunit D